MQSTGIGDAGLVDLANLPNLATLNLTDTKITDAGLARLATLTKLESLRLGGNVITDAGLVHLRGLSRLRKLDLDSSAITDAGLVHLESLTGLERLSLHGSKVSDSGVAKLQRALPKLKIQPIAPLADWLTHFRIRRQNAPRSEINSCIVDSFFAPPISRRDMLSRCAQRVPVRWP